MTTANQTTSSFRALGLERQDVPSKIIINEFQRLTSLGRCSQGRDGRQDQGGQDKYPVRTIHLGRQSKKKKTAGISRDGAEDKRDETKGATRCLQSKHLRGETHTNLYYFPSLSFFLSYKEKMNKKKYEETKWIFSWFSAAQVKSDQVTEGSRGKQVKKEGGSD